MRWDSTPCGNVKWSTKLHTGKSNPLIYASFGAGSKLTVLLGGVHPDEYVPTPLAFKFARYLLEHEQEISAKDLRVVVAPLVNPDAFFLDKPTRVNANGVDLNRNFFTLDWYREAKKLWAGLREKNPQHFPGHFPNSEIETIFQIELIEEFKPDRILSIHAPLAFLDYDGPGDRKPFHLSFDEKRAKDLVKEVASKIDNYRVVDYSFFPGSLGNFAGNERHIPTLTLELETTDPRKVDEYWTKFLPGLVRAVEYPFKNLKSDDPNRVSYFFSDYARRDNEES